MIQFEEFDEATGRVRPQHCIACEEMLADALDGSLGEVDQAWFDRHAQSCVECGSMVADAQRGAAWLELLKTSRPEPSAQLMERILSSTTGAQTPEWTAAWGGELDGGQAALPLGQAFYPAPTVRADMPLVTGENVAAKLLAFRPKVKKWRFEPRLAMTAAMAFFSLALTMNLTGVRLNEFRLSDLKPASLKRGYYETSTQALRYYDNLRVVRVLESRVEDMRQTQLDDAAARQRRSPRQAPASRPEGKRPAGPGVSRDVEPRDVQSPTRLNVADEKVRRRGAGLLLREGGLV